MRTAGGMLVLLLSLHLAGAPAHAQPIPLLPLKLGVATGVSYFSGNPALDNGGLYLEGQMELELNGPVSFLATTGCAFTSKASDRTFALRLYSAGIALKITLLSPLARVRPYFATGPYIVHFDPAKTVDDEDADLRFGVMTYTGAEYRMTRRWQVAALARVAVTRSNVVDFPLSTPRGPSRLSVQSCVGAGLFFRF